MALASTLEFLTLLVLTATLPLSVISISGFDGAPFRRVLRPLPVVFLGYIFYIAPQFLPLELPLLAYAIVSSVGVVAALVAATEATLLLTGRRAV